ncbi:arylsulfatase [Pedobacter steynii]|uniref:Arylsulfatase n=1 Tax=Pedobacter steynii TaxID=430522 RepID=A0A1G9ZD86_9SPHI|nr:arylsulfatase [Pedobacter steynii]NQX40029.1 arylsulfatase [Pedobacter steynii]SDN19400.1 arylsulfatase [Pedobacter steynii]
MNQRIIFLTAIFFGLNASYGLAQSGSAGPNVLIILADDLGFSDIGAFGSEIHTPALNQLAKEGMILNQFYNAGRCCPSRASLLTGLYPHQAGVGDMVQNKGTEAYQGYLSKHSATIAELLKQQGYRTIVSGKWHVGLVPSALAVNRGFDKSFTLQNNGSSYFNSRPLYNDGRTVTFQLNGQEVQRQDTSLYLTQAITNFALKSLDEIKDEPNPFFLYVAYNAPHWPIQALPEDIAKYKGRYLSGWDELRQERYQKLRASGLIKKEWRLSPGFENAKAWKSLSVEEKDIWDTRMAIYAAMIDRMDAGIGELLNKLKEIKRDKNTLVIFLSDNGGSADEVKKWDYVIQKNGNPGSVNSIDSYEAPWGNASNTPFRLFKKNTHEGGISSPFIAWYPGFIPSGSLNEEPAHLIDILPSILELTETKYPDSLKGNSLTALPGHSLLKVLKGKKEELHSRLFWEHEGSRAVREQDWKLVAELNAPWELYHLKSDRTETNNLAPKYPEKVKQLEKKYLEWAGKVGVQDWNKIK